MVVDGDRELLLGSVLPNHVLVKELLDFERLGDLIWTAAGGLGLVVL
jgi:hypothetical protein